MVCMSSAVVTQPGWKKYVRHHAWQSRVIVLATLAVIALIGILALSTMHSGQQETRGVMQESGSSASLREAGLGTGDIELSGQLMAQVAGDSPAINSLPAAAVDENAGREQWLGLLPAGIILAGLGALVLAFVEFQRNRRVVAQLARAGEELAATNKRLERRVDELIAEAQQSRSIAEHEQQRARVVLQDANHRIGNSLATVSSLISLQMLRSPSPVVRDALESAQARVHAIAASHRCLKLGYEFETVGADEFLDAVLEDMANNLGYADRITLAGQIEPIVLSTRDATTLGILLGELVTNAIKHAFRKADGGTITVTFKALDGVPTLSVRDNGEGLAPGQVGGEGGLGAVVVRQLAGQFGGVPRYEQPAQGGLLVTVPLPGLTGNVPKSS